MYILPNFLKRDSFTQAPPSLLFPPLVLPRSSAFGYILRFLFKKPPQIDKVIFAKTMPANIIFKIFFVHASTLSGTFFHILKKNSLTEAPLSLLFPSLVFWICFYEVKRMIAGFLILRQPLFPFKNKNVRLFSFFLFFYFIPRILFINRKEYWLWCFRCFGNSTLSCISQLLEELDMISTTFNISITNNFKWLRI